MITFLFKKTLGITKTQISSKLNYFLFIYHRVTQTIDPDLDYLGNRRNSNKLSRAVLKKKSQINRTIIFLDITWCLRLWTLSWYAYKSIGTLNEHPRLSPHARFQIS